MAAPSLVVCTSHEGRGGSRSLRAMVKDLGGVVVSSWRADVTHVVTLGMPNSSKCQRACEKVCLLFMRPGRAGAGMTCRPK